MMADERRAFGPQDIRPPSAGRPNPSRRVARTRRNRVLRQLELAAERLELLQTARLLPGDLYESDEGSNAADTSEDESEVPNFPSASTLQGPPALSLRHRTEGFGSTRGSVESPGPHRVDHEDCMPLWWKDMKKTVAQKKALSLQAPSASTRSPAGGETTEGGSSSSASSLTPTAPKGAPPSRGAGPRSRLRTASVRDP
mmetsp:Transcript_91172/g.197192  ORF Transcript_91172/g.197192 Transcript_91172/m.197192 type:complete len:199 (+) Transcript_91172:116-712(+)